MSNRLPLPLFIVAASLLSACSTPQPPAPGTATTVTTAPPASSRGKYYLDDGPLQGVTQEMIDAIPEPTPRAEPLNKWTARPYTALGKTFVPMTALTPYRTRGVASWYGTRYHGRKTASGETYDMLQLTAAHPTLPLPCYVRVTNLENGKSVIVRVNDRGPFLRDRIIDLSYAAARRLDYAHKGSARVEVELLQP